MSSIQPIRSALATETSSVPSAGATGPGVAADMRRVVLVHFAMLGCSDILTAFTFGGYLLWVLKRTSDQVVCGV